MKKTYFNAETIVAFQICGGGGNRRTVRFLGEKKIGDFTEDLFSPCKIDESTLGQDTPDLIDDNDPSAEWTDCSGNGTGLTNAMVASGIGRIDLDGDYDTVYTKRLGDIELPYDQDEVDALRKDSSIEAEWALNYMINEGLIESEEDEDE